MGSARDGVLWALLLAGAVGYQIPLATSGDVEAFQQSFRWILALSIIVAFYMAWGIGANDVANAFASSVGSKALTMRQAVLIAAIMEFVGALSMGAAVSDTVRSGILDETYFKDNPETLQLGMFCALVGASLWLCLATVLGAPVSTTHSIIGSLIGVGIATNPKSLNWGNLALVVLSWVTSPVLSGIVSIIVFLFSRTFILRAPTPQAAVSRGLLFFPFLLFFTFGVFCLYVVLKNPQTEIKDFATNTPGYAVLVALGIALGFSLITWASTFRCIRRQLRAVEENPVTPVVTSDKVEGKAQLHNPSDPSVDMVRVDEGVVNLDLVQESSDDKATSAAEEPKKQDPAHAEATPKGFAFFDVDVHQGMDERTINMHEQAEVFPAKAEKLFSYLQVISACFDSLGHGANDVANAVGPLAAVVQIYQSAKIDSKVEVPLWILALGGAGIVLGLFTYGYNVIKSIGVELAHITPSRGFSIEMGTAIVTIVGSNLGIPLSTTHCQVGSTVGVGMCEIRGCSTVGAGVNWRLMARIFAMWVCTLLFAAMVSASLFSMLNAEYNPVLAPMTCEPIQQRIQSVQHALMNVSARDSLKGSMQDKFRNLDRDGDGLLTDAELALWNRSVDLKGKKVTEGFGRRRRRTPTTLEVDDFLQYTCVYQTSLEHMLYKACEPVCADGYRADKPLECKLTAAGRDAKGNFLLATGYSGFSKCQKER